METIKTRIDKNGRLLIPSSFRQSLHLDPGQEVILYQEGNELKIRTFKESLNRARQLVKQYNKDNLDLVALLLQERREEAKDE
ncbi:MAG: hypothetical protein BGO76_01810 [Caedibacter sp. 38-128]|nr:AbrB/MazE/SpoVT family DNA-binding domain-containing protein [Holosporales bacterium]OJX05149.1 MAG: hypothetical protein BGO76_01810 [Caedibacter sp. 38-128]